MFYIISRTGTHKTMSLDQCLKKFVVSEKGAPVNYTKIGDKDLNVYGNKYFIPEDKTNEFYKAYKKHVFRDKKQAYLTEKQHEVGKIVIDLDFRYDVSVDERQHTKDHVSDFVIMVFEGVNELFHNIVNKNIEFYVFEKDNVNPCEDVTKDGIHIIMNVECDFATKMVLRDYMLNNIDDIWDNSNMKNTWNEVIDEGVMKGHVNWQLYGSQKPGKECYKLKYIWNITLDETGEITMEEVKTHLIDFDKYFPRFCARNKNDLHSFQLKEDYKDIYEKYKRETMFKQNKAKKGGLKVKKGINICNSYKNLIISEEMLDVMITELFEDPNTEYKLKEIHSYTMILSKEYWGPGSYDKWIRVGWALKNTHEDLYLTWMKMSCQSEDFSFDNHDLLEMWSNFETYNKEGLTSKSIIYWAKISNPDEYNKIYKQTIDYYIYFSFHNSTEYDLANTLYHMYKSQFVCASIKDKLWYEFTNNKWVITDSAASLRMKISTEMFNRYSDKVFNFQLKAESNSNNIANNQQTNINKPENLNPMENKIMNKFNDSEEDSFTDFKKKMNEMLNTTKMLKKTSIKANILKEAELLFYDRDFLTKLDKNPYLLGCSNCVIDFKERTHRKGKHDDYIHKSTNIIYKPLEYYKNNDPNTINEIEEFFKQLFPVPIQKNDESPKYTGSLRNYMWEHLASTLLGTNENQSFNIYNGSGANGKSKLVELMSLVLGEYKGTVPITLVTQKRNSIGGTSSEVYNLIGTRYAVMQEPSKGDKINEGVMKELTGGDPIQCRALFKDSVEFIPQFKLVVCTNTLFDILSNDDGTWRRLRKVDFNSKFTDKPNEDPKFPVEDYPHQFKIDTKIDEKFKKWAPVLLSMLVDIAYKTQGKVNDVDVVTSATDKYRQDQDIYLQYINEQLTHKPHPSGLTTSIIEIFRDFTEWVKGVAPPGYVSNKKELQTQITKKFGNPGPKTCWRSFYIKAMYNEQDEETKSGFNI